MKTIRQIKVPKLQKRKEKVAKDYSKIKRNKNTQAPTPFKFTAIIFALRNITFLSVILHHNPHKYNQQPNVQFKHFLQQPPIAIQPETQSTPDMTRISDHCMTLEK